ncbi:hypothetical protein FPOAC1_009016 [Fusarium poae]|jgi:hypothetical protein|uniref:hypothetical protein n=1 Tax=Fusarium poae TaxID=36050 RepID=UPI001CE7AB2D|nr:hypothetical protein FPOAC1_009016 [Fusarium poae]KAG8669618.1 hypothetical protein FPOAC1_009016 [Fusarium poae]
MASSRVIASRLASQMAIKAARPAVRAPVAAASKRTISGKFLMRQNFSSSSIELGAEPDSIELRPSRSMNNSLTID